MKAKMFIIKVALQAFFLGPGEGGLRPDRAILQQFAR
jgi:hypothetical protein